MASVTAEPPRPVLVDREKSRSAVWKYFAYEADERGKAKDMAKPMCKHCYRVVPTKSSSTSNLSKHLKDRHPSLYKEFRELQSDAESGESRPAAATPKHQQPSLTAVFDQQRHYDPKSREAKKINRAVTEYLCMDMVPIYTVEKSGFKQLLKQLNPRYDLPSRNHFMYTEMPALYDATKQIVMDQLSEKPYFACTTDLWTSRAAASYMAVTLQFITESWDLQSWCLGCVGLQTDHSGENIREAMEETIQDIWKLDLSHMAGITTDNASNNIKAFKEDLTWVPCFGHNLHLAINKGLEIGHVAGALSRLRKTIAAFSRSPKMVRQLKKKQEELLGKDLIHMLIHDEPTRWDSSYEMVERFLEQQQPVCAVLADDRKKWHLMPKDSDITILESVKEVLSPISDFTDALSGEKHTTLSSVLPLIWKLNSALTVNVSDSNLKCQLKDKIREDFEKRYEDRYLQLLLNTATYLDPRFKDSFPTLKEEVKQALVENQVELRIAPQPSPPTASQPPKKTRKDLKGLLTNIQGEKKRQHGDDDDEGEVGIRSEFMVYEKLPELDAEKGDPLTWWKTHQSTLPHLAQCAKKYLCIAATSCASERVFSTSGIICSPKRARLTEEHINMLVFTAKNLKLAKQIQCSSGPLGQ